MNVIDGNLIVNIDENLLCFVVLEFWIMKGIWDLCVMVYYLVLLDEFSFVVGLGCLFVSIE